MISAANTVSIKIATGRASNDARPAYIPYLCSGYLVKIFFKYGVTVTV